MLRPTSSVRSRGGWGDMSPPVKKVVPSEERNFVLGWGDAKTTLSPRHKYRKKLDVFYINITTRQQFFISVSESAKNMLKQRFPNFFQIIFEIENMN